MRQELKFYRTSKSIEIEAEGKVIATLPMIEDDGYIEPIGIGEWTDSAGRSSRAARSVQSGRSVRSGRAALVGAVGRMGGLGAVGVMNAGSAGYTGC
jgi:hypothetical protein